MLRYYVYPYKAGSRSARALATALGGRVLRREGSTFVPRHNKKVVNWGASQGPYFLGLNTASSVATMGNKLLSMRLWGHTPETSPRTPKWTDSRQEALEWLRQPNGSDSFRCKKVVSRTILNGHSGAGIVITDRENRDSLPEAPLYVEYVPKDSEYRVHIFNGEVIDVQRKVRDPDREVTDWKVRSHGNGFIYIRTSPDGRSYKDLVQGDVISQSVRAMACSGLQFAAVDIIWNSERRKAYVLECNTAPGLQGETVNIYANAIRKYYES